MRFLPPGRVRFTGGPFARAVETDLRYALSLDPARLLAPFRREAGLPPVADSYGNWEDSGLDGHIAGHYLSALALLWSATGDAGPRQRLAEMIDELAACQDAGGGYLGGVPGGRALLTALGAGGDEARAAVAALSGGSHWVPWYNLHKTVQGLLDAYEIAGQRRALAVVTTFADWWIDIADRIDDNTFEAMLDIEFGGMNDAFARLALITGRPAHAAAALRFSHRAVLEPLQRGEDALTGLHANTQIPKAIGYASSAAATGDGTLRGAAEAFWHTVVDHRTVAIGGNSVREHFHDAGDFTPMIDDREGPEFCNTYNMLKLTRALAEHELRPEHLDYAERALCNHVLASQHPDGGFVYFTSLRPRHYRVYSQPALGFWCCVGTGLEAQARSVEWVFGVAGDALAVNLYLPAEAAVPEFGGRIRVDADLATSGEVAVTLDLDAPRAFPLRLRVPGWAAALGDVTVNGSLVASRTVPGAVLIEREWRPGDTVRFTLPLEVRAERMPDGSPWQAYARGPFVLAARAGTDRLDGLRADDSRMGHVAHGALLPLADVPVVAAGTAGVADAGGTGILLRPLDPADPVVLEPFAAIHDSRYTVYWPVADDGDATARRAALRRHDEGLTLDRATVDAVALGEQQPESDHAFTAAASEVVVAGDTRWRTTAGHLSVRLAATGAATLRVRYRSGTLPTAVTVQVAGSVVAEERFDADEGVWELDYDVRGALAAAGAPEVAVVELRAPDGAPTPGVGLIRMLR